MGPELRDPIGQEREIRTGSEPVDAKGHQRQEFRIDLAEHAEISIAQVLDQDKVSTCTGTLTKPGSQRRTIRRMPFDAVARAAMSSRHCVVAGDTLFAVVIASASCEERLAISHVKDVMRCLWLSQHGQNAKFLLSSEMTYSR